MKNWYRAVCDKHKVAFHVMVSNPSCTAHYLKEYDEKIQELLSEHYGCELRLCWRDDQLDFLYDNGYNVIDVTK